jgi:hypothetical protein
MELLGDMGQVEAHFGPFGDCVNLGTRHVRNLHWLHKGIEIFLAAPSDVGQMEARFSQFADSVNLGAR